MKKSFYQILASFLSNPRLYSLFQRMRTFKFNLVKSKANGIQEPTETRNIGIWQPKVIDGKDFFERPQQGPFGDHYSDRLTIAKDKAEDVVRVCYFGESAALGYLYAPHFYPAQHLEDVLNTAPKQHFEVIDLSQTNETLDSMMRKIEASLQLAPEIFVIFAGNNWSLLEHPESSPSYPNALSRRMIAKMLLKGGYDEIADQFVKSRLIKIGEFFHRIHFLAEENNIEIVLVIPEVNLDDWESKQPVPMLAGGKINHWYRLYAECENHIQTEEWDQLLETAFKMLETDNGNCSTTYHLIGIANKGLKNNKRVKAAMQAEIDSICLPYMIFLNAPQITGYDQLVLRRTAAVYNFSLVDLPLIFEKNYPESIPGKTLFFDYCHLNKEGIQNLVSGIASEIFNIIDLKDEHSRLHQAVPKIPNEVEALAQFGAAIHTAHRLNTITDISEKLIYWCSQAYQTDPKIAQCMIDFTEARISGLPAVMTKAQQQIIQSGYNLLYSHGWKYDNLDIEIILAIQEVLKSDFPEIEQEFLNMLLAYHAVENHDYDLAASTQYLWDPLEQSYNDLLQLDQAQARAYYRAFWPKTNFIMVTGAMQPLHVKLAARVPFGSDTSSVHVTINEFQAKPAEITSEFSRLNFLIPSRHLKAGANKLTIHWSELPASFDGLGYAVERLKSGQAADLAPVFGEIFSLRVKPIRL